MMINEPNRQNFVSFVGFVCIFSMCVFMCVCMYVCIYMCMCVCLHVCIHRVACVLLS